jgi:hypothetical protein
MAEKSGVNELTVRPPLAGADVDGDDDDEGDDEGAVVEDEVVFFDELHAVPSRARAATNDTLPTRILFPLITRSLLRDVIFRGPTLSKPVGPAAILTL